MSHLMLGSSKTQRSSRSHLSTSTNRVPSSGSMFKRESVAERLVNVEVEDEDEDEDEDGG